MKTDAIRIPFSKMGNLEKVRITEQSPYEDMTYINVFSDGRVFSEEELIRRVIIDMPSIDNLVFTEEQAK